MRGLQRVLVIAGLVAGSSAPARGDDPRNAPRRLEAGGGIGMPVPAGMGFLNLFGDVRFARRMGRGCWSVELSNQIRYGFADDRALTDFAYSRGGQIYRDHAMLVFRWSPPARGSTTYVRVGAGIDVMYVDVRLVDEGGGEPIEGADGLRMGPAFLFGPGVSWPLGERGWIGAEANLGLNVWQGEWYPLLNHIPLDLDLVVVAGWSLGSS